MNTSSLFEDASPTLNVVVTNSIFFPNWDSEMGEGVAAFEFVLAGGEADWSLEIYDSTNQLAKTLTGHSDDGSVMALWNLVDTNGVTRTNPVTNPHFSAVAVNVNSGARTPLPALRQRPNTFPPHARWVMAFEDFTRWHYSEDNLFTNVMNSFALSTAPYGGYYLYYPPPGSTNDIGQTWPLRYVDPAHPDTNFTDAKVTLDVQLLLSFLANTNSRNFYFTGHGSPETIVSGELPFSLIRYHVDHRYRFVFIDACQSAVGSLDSAFGINGPGVYALQYYQNTGRRPAAFCGYDDDVSFSDGQEVTINGKTYDGTIPPGIPYYIANFVFALDLLERPLNGAFEYARDNAPDPGLESLPWDHLKIFGYDELLIDEFNHRADWPLP